MATAAPAQVARGDGPQADWRAPNWLPPNASPPRVNPYHLYRHPDSDDLLPPLSPHLARLASGEANTDDEGDSDTSDEDEDDSDEDEDDFFQRHGERRSLGKESNTVTDAETTTSATVSPPISSDGYDRRSDPLKTKSIMNKVSSVFKRGGDTVAITSPNEASLVCPVPTTDKTGRASQLGIGLSPSPGRQRSPIMQGPPPSPPLSDASDEDYASSVAVTEATMDPSDLPPMRGPEQPETLSSPDNVYGRSLRSPSPVSHLTPLTEAGESKAALDEPMVAPTFTSSLTSEPQEEQEAIRSPYLQPPSPSMSGLRVELNNTERPAPSAYHALHPPRRVSNGSTSSRAGSLTMVRTGRLAAQRDPSPSSSDMPQSQPAPLPAPLSTPQSPNADELQQTRPIHQSGSPAGTHSPLQPPRLDMSFQSWSSNSSPSTPESQRPGMPRHNTNPTVPTVSSLKHPPLKHSMSISSPVNPTGFGNVYLPPDILAQAEIVQRERLERRQKRLSLHVSPTPSPEDAQAPAALDTQPPTRAVTVSARRKETDEGKVLVGNLVAEGHRNYVLMYNMLTGIRVAVSRCQAKIRRPLTDDDYTASHKYSFDVVGNELTPSTRYDFKFKDYAPWVFRELREDHFHIDPADYLLSLTAKYILSELGSPGKSGSFFYYSRDYRFIIKTISHAEHAFMRSILRQYHEHVQKNPHTLLSRFYGLHRVKMPRGRKIHFVIMNNLFPPHRDIHETYDLKGSAWGREYPEDKAKNNPRAVLKDKNWVNRGHIFQVGPENRAYLTEQLHRDMEFLKSINVMDYSLLVGIHNMERGNRDNIRLNNLAVFQPEALVHRKPSSIKQKQEARNVRKAILRSDPKRMMEAGDQLPTDESADRRHYLFYQDEGGMRATDEQNRPMDIIYYLGIIDIATPYNCKKTIEHAWKSVTEDPVTISCVPPAIYGERFCNFLQSVMRNGDVSLRPPGLESPARQYVPEDVVVTEVTEKPVAVGTIPEENTGFRPRLNLQQGVRPTSVVEPSENEKGQCQTSDAATFDEKHGQRPATVGHLKAE